MSVDQLKEELKEVKKELHELRLSKGYNYKGMYEQEKQRREESDRQHKEFIDFLQKRLEEENDE